MYCPITYLLLTALSLVHFPSIQGVIYYHPGSRWPMHRHISQGSSYSRTLFPLYDSHRNPFWGRPSRAPKISQTTTTSPPEEYNAWPCVGELEAFDPKRGKCFRLATQGGCDKGYWWIMSQYNRPKCVKRPCQPFYTTEPNTGKCILFNQAEQLGLCPKGNKYTNDEYGKPRCVCRDNHFRRSPEHVSVCYASYEQGPCNSGFYIIFNKQKNRVECQKNLCEEDGFVPVDGECKKLGDTCGEHGEKNVYINPHDGVIGCYDFFRLPV